MAMINNHLFSQVSVNGLMLQFDVTFLLFSSSLLSFQSFTTQKYLSADIQKYFEQNLCSEVNIS